MQTIKRFTSWFSRQKLIGKLAIVISSVILVCIVCSIPIGLFSPSTPTPGISNTSVVNVESTSPSISTEKPTDVVAIVPTETPVPSATSPPTETPRPTATPQPTETSNPNLINVGTYIVNTDISSGIYKGFAGEGLFGSCYWERLKDLTGSLESIIANNNSIGQFYVEVKDSDYAFATDCQMLRLDSIPEHIGEYPQIIVPGTYLVGSDIQAGTYRGQGGSDILGSCYWERVRSVTGELDAIIANDNATGQFYVQVLPGDFALTTDCELEWVSE